MNINRKIKRDTVVSMTDYGDKVGVYFEDSPETVLLEANPEIAKKIVDLWNSQIEE